jgi:hypothetical protein
MMADQPKSIENDDPYALTGVRYEAEPGVDPDALIARCLIEEFAMMGFRPERILRLFQLPTYAGAHDILTRRGEPLVRDIIEDVFGESPAPVLCLLADEEGA